MSYLPKTCTNYIVHDTFKTCILGKYDILMFYLGIYEIIPINMEFNFFH